MYRLVIAITALLVTSLLAFAPAHPDERVAGGPALLSLFGAWGAYTAAQNGKRVCFTLAKPMTASTALPNGPRESAWIFVTTWPADSVKDEVSIDFGYVLEPDTDATVEIAGRSFAMWPNANIAWVKNPAEGPLLLETMRRGSDITVKRTSASGVVSTDVYSLRGFPQALDRARLACRRDEV
jgi:hypothetical protein